MTKFYNITRDKYANPTTVGLLKAACKARNLEYVPIYSQSFDFSDYQNLESGDVLYKVATDDKSTLVFKTLLNKHTSTIFKDYKTAMTRGSLYAGPLILMKNNLPAVKTIMDVPSDKQLLAKYVKELGGFPIIVKAMGGSHGIGVMRLDSVESLASVVDYLNSLAEVNELVLKSYIDYDIQARLIVLGDQVVDSIEYKRLKGDFRSNASSNVVVTKAEFNDDIKNNAVKAVEAYGAEFGGVDILIDKQGKGHIAEVNIPCYFPRAQQLTGTDIAGSLVDHLLQKAKELK